MSYLLSGASRTKCLDAANLISILSDMDQWPDIERLALAQGVKDATIKKWRQRGAPWRWRVQIAEAGAGEGITIPMNAFNRIAETRGAV